MASYKQYRAPRADDAALVDPTWSEQLEQLRSPPSVAAAIGGRPLESLRKAARRELLEAAAEHMSAYADIDHMALARAQRGAPLVVSGHQPELFHPGVWFKNFALSALARASGGVGVHLLIDSDLSREPSVRAPGGKVESPRVATVPYDTPQPPLPHEERALADREAFTAFPSRVRAAVDGLISDPLVDRLFRPGGEALARSNNLGGVLSELRHRLEIDWGLRTLETPISRIGDGESFRVLASELLTRPEETRSAYNAALHDYRRAHKIRTAAQPLPDLARDAGWTECPLWVWSVDRPQRKALFARRERDRLGLTDRADLRLEGPSDTAGVVEWLADLRKAGVKLRSRALVTTLFVRLVLADLFLHGIGGAKYDQVTDGFARRLLGVTPPPHATLSATLRLPISHDAPSESDHRALVGRLRDLRHHPERFSPQHPAAETKRALIDAEKTRANAAERHRRFAALNAELRLAVRDQAAEAASQLEAARIGRRAAGVLESREHSFCLYPEDDLRNRLTALARIDARG